MPTQTNRVIDEALSLPVEARLELVERLLSSLNLAPEKEVDGLWAEEAERRVAEIDAGQPVLVAGEEVFARLRAKYRK